MKPCHKHCGDSINPKCRVCWLSVNSPLHVAVWIEGKTPPKSQKPEAKYTARGCCGQSPENTAYDPSPRPQV